MDTEVNYSAVGLFVILLGIATTILFLWLSVFKHRQAYNTYLVYMREEVSGIGPQTPVRFNGVKVGYVQKIKLNPLDPQQVILILKIKKETLVTTSTVATLQFEGVIGIDYVALKALTATAPTLIVKPGEQYPVIPSNPSLSMKLSTALEDITETTKGLIDNIGKVFDGKNRQVINASLINLRKITTILVADSQSINLTIEEFPEMMRQLNSTLTSIKLTMCQFNITGRNVELMTRDARTTIQNVATQIIPSIQQLLDKLNLMTGNLQTFSRDLEYNPSILFQGKYSSQTGPGEK